MIELVERTIFAENPMEKNLWLIYVALAGLSWGTYVPMIFYGGSELGGKPLSRMVAILCVGGAYFVIGVLFPLWYLLSTDRKDWPDFTSSGLIFSLLAGVAGAVGALCVIFASKAAVDAARLTGAPPATYRMYIAPLIFGLAPIINTLVSALWHPQKGEPFHFSLDLPGWKMWVGILLVGLGAALVLFSKEEAESKHAPKPAVKVPAPGSQPASEGKA
jgi:drug/metabolite transporter (DMT)-like permease